MFDNLTERLQKALKHIRGYGKITTSNISAIMREVRLTLLEADVNYQVVREFTERVQAKALGEEVQASLNPGELFVKILKDELLVLLGSDTVGLNLTKKPSIIMLIGLQGSGKTTTIGKLASYLKKKEKKQPLLVAGDVYRPAAIEQLKQIGAQLQITVYEEGVGEPPLIAKNSLEYAQTHGYDCILIDTAGRLYLDEKLMTELKQIKAAVNPDEILLVLDSMMGQDAINVIKGFNEQIEITGTVLTKLDSDTRGGVALSVRHLTTVPIKFVGVSEKMDGLAVFDPKRMVSRIMGAGDMMSLIEKAEAVIDEDEAKKMGQKLKRGDFTLEDFLMQLKQIKKLGPLEHLIKLMPGASKLGLNKIKVDPKQLGRLEAIISSMTPAERRNPAMIKAREKERIAKGSGTSVQAVNQLLKQFNEMKKMMKLIQQGNFKFPF